MSFSGLLEFASTVLGSFVDFTIGVQTGSKATLGFYTVSMKRLFGTLADLIAELRRIAAPPKAIKVHPIIVQ